jgi:DNA repair exonuclease SbcCD ATPase subunit
MSMHLTRLAVENYKRVTAATIELDPSKPGVVALMGKNESGKSSTLDALEALIAGRKAPKVSKPVHAGESTAQLVAEFTTDEGSHLVVKRIYREDGSTALTVTEDGLKVSKASEVLDALWSHVAFDPLAFGRLDSKVQVDTLVRLVGFDPAPLDEKRKRLYDTRTLATQDVNRLKGQLAGFPDENPEQATAELVNAAAIAADLAALHDRNRTRQDAQRRALVLEQQRADAEAALNRVIEAQQQNTASIEALGEAEHAGELELALADVEVVNEGIRTQRERARVAEELAIAQDRHTNLTGLIEEVDAEKRAGFAEAQMPVPGLTIDEGEVYLEGTPFSQTSPGGMLRTGTAIAMALNPDLRAIIIRDGSLLDADNRAVIDELAKANDFHVLMEVVDENAPVGVVFEDGAIADTKGMDA